ncbi:MAG: hypothetical protein M1415_01580 [Firmicutes bacterium]|jgi:hypothetical protein|nr:hypothetical protein [Bacillota bacterium]MCL5063499.1 hypothetical protein [Bacillota bacterium]
MRISLPYDVRWGPQIPGKVRASEINGNPSLIFEEISYEDYEAGDRLLATHGHVWKTVRQMYFDAIDNKTGRLQEAYEELGLLAPKFQGTWSSTVHIEASSHVSHPHILEIIIGFNPNRLRFPNIPDQYVG